MSWIKSVWYFMFCAFYHNKKNFKKISMAIVRNNQTRKLNKYIKLVVKWGAQLPSKHITSPQSRGVWFSLNGCGVTGE